MTNPIFVENLMDEPSAQIGARNLEYTYKCKVVEDEVRKWLTYVGDAYV